MPKYYIQLAANSSFAGQDFAKKRGGYVEHTLIDHCGPLKVRTFLAIYDQSAFWDGLTESWSPSGALRMNCKVATASIALMPEAKP